MTIYHARKLFRAVATIACLSFSGCSAVDTFGDRATVYNNQMQNARKYVVLANVLRSAYDQPLQFSDVSTTTGLASSQGAIGSSLPLFGPRAGGARLFTFSPSIQVSGGPSFTVSDLNTKEFFDGISSPVENSLIASYITAGFSRHVLFPLLIRTIQVPIVNRGTWTFRNDLSDLKTYELFMSALDAMIDHGLTLDQTEKKSFVGPYLTEAELRNPKVLAQMVQGGSDEQSKNAPSLEEYIVTADGKAISIDDATEEQKASGIRKYRLVKADKKFVFCFLTREARNFGILKLPTGQVNVDVSTGLHPLPGFHCENQRLQVATRSVRGVFEYLGRMARVELASGAAAFDVPAREGTVQVVERPFGIKVAESGGTGDVTFDGQDYAVTSNDEYDRSRKAVQLLSELMAVYSSAKSFPAPSVIPLVGP